MIKNECPRDLGNASIIANKTTQGSNFVMERLEDLFDFFSEEPVSIMVKEEENSIEEDYICILRIRIWNQRQRGFSWSIYSKDRETLNNLIIRRVIWNLEKDKEEVKNIIRNNRAEALEMWPSIEIYNQYISSIQSDHVIHLISNLDSEIKNGFVLHKNSNPTWEWRDLEMLRLYDWGQIHFTWCTEKRNEDIEKKMQELILGLNFSIKRMETNIFKMKLNYSISPEEYKNSLNR